MRTSFTDYLAFFVYFIGFSFLLGSFARLTVFFYSIWP